MSCCGDNKPKYNCGERIASTCVFYSKYFPKYSELKDSDCVTLEETTEELYKKQEHILEHLDTKNLGRKCLEYSVTDYDGKDVYLVKDVLSVFEDEICRLKNNSVSNGSTNGVSGNYDLKCLTDDPCFKYKSSDDIINLLVEKICNLEQRVKELENGV